MKIEENDVFGETSFTNIEGITDIRSVDVNDELQEVYIVYGPFWQYNLSIISYSGEIKETL